ncbi:hypothetical protein AVEN_9297-1 [Araneus ventricosus]|uniref:Uncharacterized protein n=1 Tax=Araneus ventricosus TaxID=182803 RepID=A0A4Y2C8N7_ARAVE|nr:hypothetical protein AVEN_192245-1 [Araneus ventricosus]GBM00694.1 hypothetical protein AVEN_9297-1 [Araneus ventricosus]
MNLAYAECPQDVREGLAVQFFVDAIRDEDTQLCRRLMGFTDLKSALAYSMKYEVSNISMHTRPIRLEDNAGKKKKMKSLNLHWERWKNYWTDLLLGRKTPLDGIRT